MSANTAGVEEEDSVYTLLTSLCKKVLEKNEPFPSVTSKHNLGESHLKRLRSLGFGIMLGKTHQDDNQNIPVSDDLNPLAQLIAYSYSLHASGEKRLGCQLDHCIDEVLKSSLAKDPTSMAVIHLLTLLKDRGSGRSDLLSQDPFDLSRIYPPVDAVFKNSLYPAPMPYTTPSPSLFVPPHWMNCHESKLHDRKYSAQFPFMQKPGEGLQYLSKFTVMFQKDRVTSRPTYKVRTIGILNGPRSLAFSSPSPSVVVQEDEGYFTPDLDKPPERTQSDTSFEDPTEIWSRALQVKEPLFRNWDSRGLPIGERDLPYLSAAPAIATFCVWQVVRLNNNIYAETSGQKVSWVASDHKPISRKLFLEHAIYLLQGIESLSFLYEEVTDEFVVRPGLWIEGLTPDSVVELSEDLLICGTYFRRLERMTQPRNHSDAGTILQALRGSLRRFVQTYRATVLNISAEMSNRDREVSLSTLIRKIQTLKQQVECLGRLYRLTPGETALPSGIEFIPHIYQELCRSMRRSQTCVLYSALTSCCEVYYRRLERWIFLGNCFDDDREEFFIRPDIQLASQRNRIFWTKSFVLNESLVPDFLRGLETTIFQCGRAVHVLRLCNPGHPFCVLLEKEHPTIRCSLQMSDLEAIQRDCAKFEAEVRRVCGEFVTVSAIFQEAREQERKVQQLIQKSHEERAIAQAVEAAKLARERAAAKQAQLKELKEQMFAAEQRHQAMIEREKEEEARFLEETRKIEEMAELSRQEERAKLLKYYEALNEHIMRRERRVEWRLKRLHLSERREQFLAEDSNRLKEEINSAPVQDSATVELEMSTKTMEQVEGAPTEKLVDISSESLAIDCQPSEIEMMETVKKAVLTEEFDIDAESESKTEYANESSKSALTDYSLSLDAAKEAAVQAGINKLKMLESEYGNVMSAQIVTEERFEVSTCAEFAPSAAEEAALNKRKVLGSEFGIVSSSNFVEGKRLDVSADAESVPSAAEEAALNKRKVLGSEFGIVSSSNFVEKKRLDVSADAESVPSAAEEAALNKRKVLGSEFGIVSSSNFVEEKRLDVSADAESVPSAAEEAALNKWKVLGSEFGIAVIPRKEQTEISVTTEAEKNRSAMMKSTCLGLEAVSAEPTSENIELSDLEKNKRRVLQEEFDFGIASSKTGSVFKVPGDEVMSDRMRNKLRVMGEEFDILTGEPRRRYVQISEQPSPTKESRSVAKPDERESEVESEDAPEVELKTQDTEVVSTDSASVTAVMERPKVLQLTKQPSQTVTESESAKMYASTEDQSSDTSSDKRYNLSRAYSIDSSLFKRTPSTPFSMSTSFGTSVIIDGAPLMVDILDRFLGSTPPALPAQTPTPSEASGLADVSPSAVWLGTSLQQGLLFPLRTHHGLVSSALLQFFLRDLNLLSHLRSLRSYFFLLDGEFGRRLTSQVFTQMYQVATPAGLLNGLTLNNLLAAALSQSYSGADPNSSLLSFSVSTVPQHFSHSSPGALDCLHLHYRATWPINLILTEEALDKYNLIFVFLIRLRRVAWLLQEDFIVLKSTARQCNSQQRRDLLNSPEYHQVQIIRHCMSQFVQATQSYVTSAVLQASWTYLEQALQQATTLDNIYNAHIAYIKHVLKRCLLNQNSKRVEAVLNKVLSCVLKFHSLVRVRAWQGPSTSTPGQRGYLQHPNFSKMVVCFKMFRLQVCKLTCYLEKLVAPPHQQTHLAEFLLLINLKDFYPASEHLKRVTELKASAGDSI